MKTVESLRRHLARNPENYACEMPENHFGKIRHGRIVVRFFSEYANWSCIFPFPVVKVTWNRYVSFIPAAIPQSV